MSIRLVMSAEEMQKDHVGWLNLRKNYIGGSDAAIVAGINTYSSPYKLWLEKTGQVESEDLSDNLKIWFGKEAEELVAKKFCEDERKKVRRTGVWVNDKYPWASASIDRMVVGENAFLECKTSSGLYKDRWADDQIPDAYYCQVLHYMTVLELDYCYIACLFDNGTDYVVRRVEFNQEDSDELMAAEKKFWEECIQGGKMPAADSSEACAKALQKRFPGGDSEPLELQGEMDILCGDILSIEQSIRELKEVLRLKQNKLKLAMENHEFGRSLGYNVWYRTTAKRPSFDREQFDKDYPDVYERYLRAGVSRRLRIKERKNK